MFLQKISFEQDAHSIGLELNGLLCKLLHYFSFYCVYFLNNIEETKGCFEYPRSRESKTLISSFVFIFKLFFLPVFVHRQCLQNYLVFICIYYAQYFKAWHLLCCYIYFIIIFFYLFGNLDSNCCSKLPQISIVGYKNL